jgi:hypothetical protein
MLKLIGYYNNYFVYLLIAGVKLTLANNGVDVKDSPVPISDQNPGFCHICEFVPILQNGNKRETGN